MFVRAKSFLRYSFPFLFALAAIWLPAYLIVSGYKDPLTNTALAITVVQVIGTIGKTSRSVSKVYGSCPVISKFIDKFSQKLVLCLKPCHTSLYIRVVSYTLQTTQVEGNPPTNLSVSPHRTGLQRKHVTTRFHENLRSLCRTKNHQFEERKFEYLRMACFSW